MSIKIFSLLQNMSSVGCYSPVWICGRFTVDPSFPTVALYFPVLPTWQPSLFSYAQSFKEKKKRTDKSLVVIKANNEQFRDIPVQLLTKKEKYTPIEYDVYPYTRCWASSHFHMRVPPRKKLMPTGSWNYVTFHMCQI